MYKMLLKLTKDIPNQALEGSLFSSYTSKEGYERITIQTLVLRLNKGVYNDKFTRYKQQELDQQNPFRLRELPCFMAAGLSDSLRKGIINEYNGCVRVMIPSISASTRELIAHDRYILATLSTYNGLLLLVRTDLTDHLLQEQYQSVIIEYIKLKYELKELPKPGGALYWPDGQYQYFNEDAEAFTSQAETSLSKTSLVGQSKPGESLLSARINTDLYEEVNTQMQTPHKEQLPPILKTEISEITAKDLLSRNIETIPCLIEPIFQAVGLATVAGSSDTGKSCFLRQLAFAVATGESEFLGWSIKAKHQSAIFVSTEDSEEATAYLLTQINNQRNKAVEDCERLRFIFDTTDVLRELDRRLTQSPADLVVIDAFGDLYQGDANRSNDIRKFLHEYNQLAQKHQCLALWLHHTGKRTDDGEPSKHNLIGGQGFEGKMRLVVELRKDHHDPYRRHLCVVKGNYLPSEYKEASFVLTFDKFLFENTGERVSFDQLVRAKDPDSEGKAKYAQIQELRQQGYKGQALVEKSKMSKSYISKIESRYGAQPDLKSEVS